MALKLYQGMITTYDADDPRTCTVMQLPDGYLVNNVMFARLLQNQTRPLEKSIVLYAVLDSYNAYIVSVLREPINFLDASGQLTGSTGATALQLTPGEVFFESRGDPALYAPGTGATFRLSNDGTVSIFSGLRKEYLVLGGSDSDDDGEVILNGDNGFLQSNINDVTMVQSTFNFDQNNNIQIANLFSTIGTSLVQIPIGELKIDTFGNIHLHNYIGAVENGALFISSTGFITLNSGTGGTINFNNGANGVARLNDSVLSNAVTDVAFWTFIETLVLSFNTHTHIVTSPGQPTSPPVPLITSEPSSLTSQISSSSTTVFSG